MSLGKLTDLTEENKKDAVHVATVVVRADKVYKPGERYKNVGIVDPWLKENVRKHHYFTVLLDPGTVKNLSHTWDHPEFPDKDIEPDFDTYGCNGC